MRIRLTSIMVDDQDKALRFYTDVLGFKKKRDIPVGRVSLDHGDITGRSRRSGAGARAERQPGGQGVSDGDVRAGDSVGRLRGGRHRRRVQATDRHTASRSPKSRRRPVPITLAVFADTCGNLIQIYQAGLKSAPQRRSFSSSMTFEPRADVRSRSIGSPAATACSSVMPARSSSSRL